MTREQLRQKINTVGIESIGDITSAFRNDIVFVFNDGSFVCLSGGSSSGEEFVELFYGQGDYTNMSTDEMERVD